MRLSKNLFTCGLLAILAASLLPACSLPLSRTSVDLSLDIVSGAWGDAAQGRFLTLETSTVTVEAHEGSETGPVLATQNFAVVHNGTTSTATGKLKLTLGTQVVVVAEVRGVGKVYARGVSAAFVVSATSAPTITLLPTIDFPNFYSVGESDSIEIDLNGQTTALVQIDTANKHVKVEWNMGAFNILYQVRSATGAILPTAVLSGNTGIEFDSVGANPYVLLYNADSSAINIPYVNTSADLLAKLATVNSIGEAYITNDGNVWAGPYDTGLDTAYDVVSGAGVFVAGGSIGSQAAYSYSTDGIVWTAQSAGVSGYIMDLAVNDSDAFLAAELDGATVNILGSDDGTSFAQVASGVVAGGSTSIGWDGSYWYISNTNTASIKKSTTGTTWSATSGTPSGGFSQANALFGLNGHLLIGGGLPSAGGKQVSISSNGGTTWTAPQTLASSTDYVKAFAANPNNNRIVLAGTGANYQAYYSDNYGSSWTNATVPVSNAMSAVGYWTGGFIMGDTGGNYYPSTNGTAFTSGSKLGSSPLVGFAPRSY